MTKGYILEYNGYIIVCRRLPRDIGQEA